MASKRTDAALIVGEHKLMLAPGSDMDNVKIDGDGDDFGGHKEGQGTHHDGIGSSSIGKQAYSTNKTFPRYGFGTSDRDMASRVFISPKHAESGNYGMSSPGPAFINNSVTGMHGSRYGFGTDGRFTREQRQLSDSSELPG